MKRQSLNSHRRRKPIAEAVGDALESRGLGLNQVERMTNGELSHSFLSKLITGTQANPRLDKLIKIADLLDVSLSELLGELEPEGLRVSKIWQLYRAYEKLREPRHRKMVDVQIEDLMTMIEGFPKK
jgi:transcriptional regulator with XRE-family HTH domain